jgi:sulfate transport system ATP-binding protein
LLQLVHLENFADRYPAQLSGGQRQRMALARALAVSPDVLLLDEPFGALDAQVRKELRAWLRRLHDEVHVTTVFVTHDQEEAMEVADEIVVINDGVVEQIGTPDDLYDRPANDFVMNFLGPVTSLGGRAVRPHDIELFRERRDGAQPAIVERIVRLGFEVRVDVVGEAGSVWVQMTRSQADRLQLAQGDRVYVLPVDQRNDDIESEPMMAMVDAAASSRAWG